MSYEQHVIPLVQIMNYVHHIAVQHNLSAFKISTTMIWVYTQQISVVIEITTETCCVYTQIIVVDI